MTDEEKPGALASVVFVAYLGILALAGAWVARVVVFVIYCVLEYRNGK